MKQTGIIWRQLTLAIMTHYDFAGPVTGSFAVGDDVAVGFGEL